MSRFQNPIGFDRQPRKESWDERLSWTNDGDVTVAEELSEDIVECVMIGDRGYGSDKFRRALAGNNNEVVIPGRGNQKKEIVYAKEEYKKRGEIERVFGKIKENRRLTVMYEKSDINFLGFIFIMAQHIARFWPATILSFKNVMNLRRAGRTDVWSGIKPELSNKMESWEREYLASCCAAWSL